MRLPRNYEAGPSEKEFMQQVIDLAQLRGWKVYHTHDSRRCAAGFPDLVMVRCGVLVFAELKRLGGKPTAAQREWLDSLARVLAPEIKTYLWTPDDWDQIARALK